MHIDDLIYRALLETHADDMTIIRRYVQWLKVRRHVNQFFYDLGLRVHWVKPSRRYHWVGK